ncbi:hypothetical protein [Arthrobacter sp. AQ5-05]|uniref:hypothetical protein n=1 Tax=Arthrobacter sp. AQ5-05 TaxID=2184581 RepID=UPI001C660CEC|nr:hypothetical protein [Arthrobacter sp. AQ5-05]
MHALVRDLLWAEVPVTDTTNSTGYGWVVIRKIQLVMLVAVISPDWPRLRQ